MPAFTHLCNKVNFSLAYNTLTIYPKKTGKKVIALALNACRQIIQLEKEEHYPVYNSFDEKDFAKIGSSTFVHRNDAGHYLLHEDNFNIDDEHCHLKFLVEISEERLGQILTIFTGYQIITAIEKNRFLAAYKQANPLNIPANSQLNEMNAVKQKSVLQRRMTVEQQLDELLGMVEEQPLPEPSLPEPSLPESSQNIVESPADPTPLLIENKAKSRPAVIYNSSERNFLLLIDDLAEKAQDLRGQVIENPASYYHAANIAENLAINLRTSAENYFEHKNPATFRVFKKEYEQLIDDSRKTLEEHRGWKNILANLGCAILGLGVGYLVAASVNYYKTDGKHFFFQFKTDSAKKLDNIEEAIPLVAPTA